VTWQIDWDDPRSTSSHCGSLNALDHRVPVLPSTAAEAGNEAFSVEDAVAVLPSATFVVPQLAATAVEAEPGGMPTVSAAATSNPATRLSAVTAAAKTRRRSSEREVRVIAVLPGERSRPRSAAVLMHRGPARPPMHHGPARESYLI